MDWMTDPQAWIALVTLTALEIVLGIDNIVFISILTGKLHEDQRQKGRIIGLALAMIMRILLLLTLAWVVRLTAPMFTVFGNEISGRDLILIAGGLFLLGKATHEIHEKLEGEVGERKIIGSATFASVMFQIVLLDIVFSLDSVITAVGMVRQIPVMVIAIILAVLFMMLFAKPIGDFVENHPTVKMLALSFLLLIGMALVADGLDFHIPKGYIYFAMGFSVFVEALNLRLHKTMRKPLKLRQPSYAEEKNGS
jgi:predicted tellurium resistance membrane protein TerC